MPAPTTIAELGSATALVMPAWIEHEPRIALRALAMGIPVIASRACGLPSHPLLTEIDAGDVEGLKSALERLTRTEPACADAQRSLPFKLITSLARKRAP